MVMESPLNRLAFPGLTAILAVNEAVLSPHDIARRTSGIENEPGEKKATRLVSAATAMNRPKIRTRRVLSTKPTKSMSW